MLKSVMHQILITCLLRKYISINIEFNFIRGVTISKVKHKRPKRLFFGLSLKHFYFFTVGLIKYFISWVI